MVAIALGGSTQGVHRWLGESWIRFGLITVRVESVWAQNVGEHGEARTNRLDGQPADRALRKPAASNIAF